MTSGVNTHLNISHGLCGKPEYTKDGKAKVTLKLTKEMSADEKGLIHGGFIFGLADHAAMVAVNEPNVVLASASCKFLKPSATGDFLTACAEITSKDKNKFNVNVVVLSTNENKVFEGDFFAVVPKNHVLG